MPGLRSVRSTILINGFFDVSILTVLVIGFLSSPILSSPFSFSLTVTTIFPSLILRFSHVSSFRSNKFDSNVFIFFPIDCANDDDCGIILD